jgi:hypothetical protein
MTYIAYKFERTGNGLKERLHVKAFKTMNDLGAFLSSKHNDFNIWKQDEFKKYPQKSGVYAFAGGQWHNVKSLDSSVLAHI